MDSYHSLDYHLKQRYGKKIYKLALDGGMTCPNRDGTLGTGGCIFCSHGGSGDFAVPAGDYRDVWEQIEEAKKKVASKVPENSGYIAYFQSYTNTYQTPEYLEALFGRAISHKDVVGLSIGTRPDCITPEIMEVLKELNQRKSVWVELGLQTIHPSTAALIRRGYDLPCFEQAFQMLKDAGLTVVVHVILGLPGESREMIAETIRYLGNRKVDGIKLQLLHVLKGTKLAELYEQQPFPIYSLEEYVDLVIDCIALLPPEVVIHRISGDGPKSLLIAPLWSGNKRMVLNAITRRFRERQVRQGDAYSNLEYQMTPPMMMQPPKT